MVVLQIIDVDDLTVTLVQVQEEHHDLAEDLHGKALQTPNDPAVDKVYDLLGGKIFTVSENLGHIVTLEELHDKDEAIDHLYWFFYN